MALLDGTTDAGPDDEAARAAITAGREEPAPAADDIPLPPEPNKPVALAPPKPRRAKIEEDYARKLGEVADSLQQMRSEVSRRDQQIGELTGHIRALSERPAYQPQYQPQQQPPQLPDPDELERRALDALDKKDMREYQRLTREAGVASTLRAIQPALAQMRQQQAPAPQADQMPPALMPYFAAHPDVARHPQAMQLLAAKNVELGVRGMPLGPERVAQIFQEVEAIVKSGRQAASPSFSRSSAGVLAGTPTARPSNGSAPRAGEPRVELTTEERRIAKGVGMDEARYASLVAKNDPNRILR